MTKESFKSWTTQVLINKLHLLNTNSMTIVYFRFLGNWRVSLVSAVGASLNLVELFPRKSVISDEFMTFKNISCLPNWYRSGFSLHPPRRLCLAKCSSRGSCVNFSGNKNFTPSSARSSFASETKYLTKENQKFLSNPNKKQNCVNNTLIFYKRSLKFPILWP